MRTSVLALCLVCAACTYIPGAARTKPGSTDADTARDVQACETEAQLSPGSFVAAFIPFSDLDKRVERAAFIKCMQARGYDRGDVIPPER
jgi:hypothetical protein